MGTPVTIPLINPNEPEALLAALNVKEGQHVSTGDSLAALETTKSAVELQAEREGYIVGLRLGLGQTVHAGEILCYIADNPDWSPPEYDLTDQAESTPSFRSSLPDGMRITQPALALAQKMGLDLTRLPADQLVTESLVRALLDKPANQVRTLAIDGDFDPAAIIVYGGGGHGKALLDLLHALQVYQVVGVIDDGIPAGESMLGIPILGGKQILADLHKKGIRQAVNAVGGIGNISIRIKVFQHLAEAGFICPTVIHPAAYIETSARLSPGVQVFAHAYVGSDARLDFGAIVNTGAIVSHDCILENYANISPGALLAGEARIGAGALIGMGATINLQVKVGAGARVGNGATVKEDVPQNGIVRAGTIWPG